MTVNWPTVDELTVDELTVAETSGTDPRVAPLVAAMKAEMDLRYPEEVGLDHPQVLTDAVFLLVLAAGEPVGTCAVQLLGAEAELKRMYVRPDQRGRGVAGRLMREAEAVARRAGCARFKLETGVRQPEAIAVYERAGFARIPNYPPFDGWELSVCFAKDL
ncbi:N-acetyltransferase [Catellatospora sp. TT07R-123]|uniref:GNAT family N-acetyltransferase n=1 Tax=Catellatospora sp. TT07R-123 TaxID=2733863 RepID=UPI001B2D73BB|nr:GNAT family N-acetyltransferase [Catellatospora sp. TT07R-123]GHJ49184.1 N-acetyltransferase [Catellatospora sp. TT07R-123]